jgi:ABC-type lipoprotein release transport system permease subunit
MLTGKTLLALLIILGMAIVIVGVKLMQFFQDMAFQHEAETLTRQQFIAKYQPEMDEEELGKYWDHVQQGLQFDNGYEDDNHY